MYQCKQIRSSVITKVVKMYNQRIGATQGWSPVYQQYWKLFT